MLDNFHAGDLKQQRCGSIEEIENITNIANKQHGRFKE